MKNSYRLPQVAHNNLIIMPYIFDIKYYIRKFYNDIEATLKAINLSRLHVTIV